jgi:hypothetical protein
VERRERRGRVVVDGVLIASQRRDSGSWSGGWSVDADAARSRWSCKQATSKQASPGWLTRGSSWLELQAGWIASLAREMSKRMMVEGDGTNGAEGGMEKWPARLAAPSRNTAIGKSRKSELVVDSPGCNPGRAVFCKSRQARLEWSCLPRCSSSRCTFSVPLRTGVVPVLFGGWCCKQNDEPGPGSLDAAARLCPRKITLYYAPYVT